MSHAKQLNVKKQMRVEILIIRFVDHLYVVITRGKNNMALLVLWDQKKGVK